MSDVLVQPLLRILANGRRVAKDGTAMLRFTLVATPEHVAGGPGAFALSEWPAEMAARIAGGISLHHREIVAAEIPPLDRWNSEPLEAAAAETFGDDRRWREVAELWRAVLYEPSSAEWETLAKDIKNSLVGKKREVSLAAAYAGDPVLDPGDGALLSERPGADATAAIRGIVPIRQSDFAVEEESLRAARVLRKLHHGPSAVLDDLELPEETAKAGTIYKQRFDAATKATDPDRSRSHAAHVRIRRLLDGTARVERPVVESVSLVPRPDAVVGKGRREGAVLVEDRGEADARATERGSHNYGTWLQRQPSQQTGRVANRVTPASLGQGEDKNTPAAHRQRLQAAYFALQGDPLLARLFCLVADFEIAESRIAATYGAGVRKLHLAVAPTPGTSIALVATAAKLHEGGFWPVSAFEALVVGDGQGGHRVLDEPSLVEQTDGVWRLGENVGSEQAPVPRYTLASLDLRRSVDSKTRGRDRGENQLTGGFTILDRGRAEQVARDLALAELQGAAVGDAGKVVVLHAEELTIGRRVDVAAAAAGTGSGALEWRTLMRRYVDFDFGSQHKAARETLARLLPQLATKQGFVDEASFQVAARYMPVSSPSDTLAPCEAVPEEAIFLWDGTPAGVLTDARPDPERKPDSLPVGRIYDLPEVGPRPAPLRFSVPYQMCCRSTFLGGGSPDVDDPATRKSIGDEAMVPAAAHGRARPRRFLRHEAIAAPVLMLPCHLATERRAQMGFEQADQAIVRSWNDAPAHVDDLDDPNVVRGAYVGGDIRTTPDVTMRVLVPPEVALDLVVRHGRLDVADPQTIRRGGLRDVTYVPAPPPRPVSSNDPQPEPEPSGFPVVTTSRRDTLDAEGAIYRRTMSTATQSSERGIPVFEPGGTNSTKVGAIGYLPDPAIDHYSIRARIRGSDRYLAGHVEVPLYAGCSYPNALPLVVVVCRRGGPAALRPRHPTQVCDIIGKPATLYMGRNGELGRAKRKGTRVQRVEITLWPGEDFDLEIACLPSDATLARSFAVPETVALHLRECASDPASHARIAALCGRAGIAAAGADTVAELIGLAGRPLPAMQQIEAAASRLLRAMQGKWPIEEIAAVTTLRVCHAVNKPPLAASWREREVSIDAPPDVCPAGKPRKVKAMVKDVAAFRPRVEDAITCENIFSARFADTPGGTALLLEGTVEVDLALVDQFQIVAETVATDGTRLDTRERGRSMISKRSGRWPMLIEHDGTEAYVTPEDVVGFKVAADGVVTLPRRPVTLLSVGNLPTHGAVGEQVVPCTAKDGSCRVPDELPPAPIAGTGTKVFGETRGRLTSIALGPLFAAASRGIPITQRIGMRRDALDPAERTRVVTVERPHAFKDTLARKLTLRLVAVSRFAGDFETAPTYVNGREQALYRRQPLRKRDQALRNLEGAEIWMRATARPAAPDLRRPEPSFTIERMRIAAADGKTTHTLVRRAATRLWFGRGWYSSGEGERLGIVLWPPRYDTLTGAAVDKDRIPLWPSKPPAVGADQAEAEAPTRILDLSGFEDADLGRGGAFVTRWGGDPIRHDKTPQTGFFIPPEAFGDLACPAGPHRPRFVPHALMPVPRNNPPAEAVGDAASTDGSAATSPAGGSELPIAIEYLPVSLLTFEPCFDLDREEWYVDVDLRPVRAAEPFVRFGLVRYQEHAISDALQLSEPVTVTMQLLPDRKVEISEEKLPASEDTCIKVRVSGRGSADIKDLAPSSVLPDDRAETALSALRRPRMKLHLFHERDAGDSRLVRVPLGRDGDAVQDPGEEAIALPEPGLDGATLVWGTEFNLSSTRLGRLGPGRIVAYLEEVDVRMPASYRSEPITLATMFAPGTFVESGPRFSARVPFLATT